MTWVERFGGHHSTDSRNFFASRASHIPVGSLGTPLDAVTNGSVRTKRWAMPAPVPFSIRSEHVGGCPMNGLHSERSQLSQPEKAAESRPAFCRQVHPSV